MMFGPLPDTAETWIKTVVGHTESAAIHARILGTKVRQWLRERDMRIDDLEAENANLRAALSFARSAIRSGEPWTNECERIIGGALIRPAPSLPEEQP